MPGGLQPVHAGGDAGSAETVVDIDDGDVGGTGIEHAKKSGNAPEAGAVADAGRNGNDWRGHEAADHAGKSAFHPRDTDDDASLRQLAFAMFEQAMNARDADVVELIDAVAHHAGREQGFFGYGNVAGASGDDENQAFARDLAPTLDGDDAGERVELRGVGTLSVGFFHGGENFSVGASDENIVARVFLLEHGADDFSDLLRRFAFGENDFGEALTQSAMMVDFGKTQVLKRQVLEALDGPVGRELPGLYGFQNFQQFRLMHAIQPLEILSLARRLPRLDLLQSGCETEFVRRKTKREQKI
jgi:hypothetical protein